MSETVTCRVCGDEIGKGPNGLGIKSHANKHRREFEERFFRPPEDYAEVRDRLGDGRFRSAINDPNQETLWEALNDPEQASLPWGSE